MTRTMIALLTSAALVFASAVTVRAQGKKGSAPKPQHVSSKTTTTKVSSPKTTSGSKTSGPKKTTTQPSKAPKTTTKSTKSPKTPKTTSSPATKSAKADAKATKAAKSETKAAKTDAKAAKSETKAAKSEKTSSTTTTTTTTTTTSGEGEGDTPVTLTKVQEKLQKNTKLAEKLEGRLPDGMKLMDAAEGFRNLGQFVAAVNVSNNLGLDFEKLKTAMVDDGKSLGQAIQYVKKDVESPTLVAQRAESEAQTLIQQTEKTTTSTTTTTTTSTTTTKAKSKAKPKKTVRAESGS